MRLTDERSLWAKPDTEPARAVLGTDGKRGAHTWSEPTQNTHGLVTLRLEEMDMSTAKADLQTAGAAKG